MADFKNRLTSKKRGDRGPRRAGEAKRPPHAAQHPPACLRAAFRLLPPPYTYLPAAVLGFARGVGVRVPVLKLSLRFRMANFKNRPTSNPPAKKPWDRPRGPPKAPPAPRGAPAGRPRRPRGGTQRAIIPGLGLVPRPTRPRAYAPDFGASSPGLGLRRRRPPSQRWIQSKLSKRKSIEFIATRYRFSTSFPAFPSIPSRSQTRTMTVT